MMNVRALLTTSAIGIAATLPLAPLHAQSVADFYKGKTVTVLVGSGVGGGYDTYSRALVRYWGKHIPGNPNMLVQNMPGANGITMMNHLVHAAAKDGTVIGSAFANNVVEPIMDQGKVTKFDSRQVNWIGNIAPQYNACFVRKDSAAKSLEDVMKFETHISATGANSNSSVMAKFYNALLGTKFKVISGYSTAESILAIERKEVDGTCVSYDNLLASNPYLIENNLITWLILLNTEPVPTLPDTPPATKFAKSEEDRQVIELLAARNLMGRPYVAAPGVPADRLNALRNSFMATMKDPAYLEETKKLKMTVDPVDFAAMEKMVASAYKIPASTVSRAIELTKD